MKTLLVEYLNDFLTRGNDIAFAYKRGLRTYRWSYRDTAMLAREFSAKLEKLQIGRGDRVIFLAANSAEWVAAFFGCLLRGAIVVPLDVQSESGFLDRVQQQVEAKLVVLDETTRKSFNTDLQILLLEQLSESQAFLESAASVSSVKISSSLSEDDVVEIVFTSGTTADPKGVQITNRNLMSNLLPLEQEIQLYRKWARLVHPIRFLNLLPLSHVFGQFMGLFVPQLLGGTVFFSDSLNPSHVIDIVGRKRISVIACVPRFLETLREKVERNHELKGQLEEFRNKIDAAQGWSFARRWWEFRGLHWSFGMKFWAFVAGGATLNEDTEKFWERLGFAVIQGYGMTETASLISVNHPFKKRRRSIGKIMPGQEVKLAKDGEILVRGENVSPGYWRKGASESKTEDGWFRTGDVGELDEEGNLYFKGRSKEVIVSSSGMNIYPDDIEAVLNRQPEIRESTVVGFDGPSGPEPLAVLILDGGDEDIREVINRVNESLGQHQQIRRWFIWPDPDFPRTATQKVRKPIVAKRVKSAFDSRVIARPGADPLAEMIARISGEMPVRLEPTARLGADLKLDSLGRVELLSAIEDRYQVEINEAEFNEATTIADIKGIIRRTSKAGTAESKPDEPLPLSQEKESTVEKSLSITSQSIPTQNYPYPHWPHLWPLNWLRIALLYIIIFPLTRIMGRATVRGLENVRDAPGPLLFVSNHLSMVDHGLILWALPGRFRRRMSIAMDGELLREWLNPPKGTNWFTRARYRIQYILVALFFNVFAMPRHSGFRRSFSFAGELVDMGYSVTVFPEGLRSPDGSLQPFKSGIGLLAKDLNIPVVPIGLDGIHELAQQGKHFASRGDVTVTVGRTVTYSAESTAEEITKDLERRIRKLVNG